MKSKAGLHKKISSIFDGVPIHGTAEVSASASPAPAGLSGKQGGDSAASKLASAEGIEGSLPVLMDTDNSAHPGTTGSSGTAAVGRGWFKGLGKSNAGSPKKPVVKFALIGVLMVVLILVLTMALGQPSAGKAAQPKDPPDKVPTAKKSANLPVWPLPDPYQTGLRDPMVIVQPPKPVEETPAEAVQPAQFVIKGVVLGAKGNTAIVGNEIVSVGDQVQGATVIRIDRGEVEFEKDGQRWVQAVNP